MSQIPPNRALAILGDDGAILPDLKRRMMRDFQQQHGLYQLKIKVSLYAMAIGLIAIVLAIILSITLGVENSRPTVMSFIMFAVVVGGGGLLLGANLDRKLSFPCPHCNSKINLLEKWVCGNCRKVNNDSIREFAMPLDRCQEKLCSQPQQTAICCPNCDRHIIINRQSYDQNNSASPPFRSVADYEETKAYNDLMSLAMNEFTGQNKKSDSKQFFDD